jgi:hypothetical protein
LAIGFLIAPTGIYAEADVAPAEIEHLLTFVGTSSCEFYRNGSWYDAAHAQAHLHEKLMMLTMREPVRSAEEFIEKVATSSAFTTLAYRVRCHGGADTAVNGWLAEELRRYRRCVAVRCVSHLMRDTPGMALAGSAPQINHRVER